MRRFALGCLNYTPERFGRTIVGDFLDAMTGYNEAESERVKRIAEIIRSSTTILWNIQVDKTERLTPAQLWPFIWDKTNNTYEVELTEEEVRKSEAEMEKILNNIMPG